MSLQLHQKKNVIFTFVTMMMEDEDEFAYRKSEYETLFSLISTILDQRDRLPPMIHTDCLLHGGANHVFWKADDQTIEKITRINRETFEYLFQSFLPFWNLSLYGGNHARKRKRVLSGRGALGITLFYLAHAPSMTALSLFSGLSQSSCSRYIHHILLLVEKALDEIVEACIICPPPEYLKRIGELSGHLYGTVMKGCVIVIDGSLHHIEKDELANSNFFYDDSHIDYNGWKSIYCKKGLYFFCMDGTLVWYAINVPGSWADGFIFDRSSDLVDSLPAGTWILGDSAFPIIPGKVERHRKRNELLSNNPERARFQMALDAHCQKARISSEWGVKDLKRSWLVLYTRLPSDDPNFRMLV